MIFTYVNIQKLESYINENIIKHLFIILYVYLEIKSYLLSVRLKFRLNF